MLVTTQGWEYVLYLTLASTGPRIGEALALECKHLINGGRTLRIEQQVNRFGKIVPFTKTKAGIREVDLHPNITDCRLGWVRSRKGLLFCTRNGTPFLSGNVQKRKLMKHTKKSFHAFRRFRNTHLREQNCQQDILIFWMGHKPSSMSELYSKLSRNLKARLAEAERVGLGFKVNLEPEDFQPEEVVELLNG